MPLPLLALAISAFAIGTTEFVIMGLLPDVARDLAVTLPSAGLLVSGYALGVAAGAPLLAVLTSKMPRKAALQLLMAIFIVGNVLCAVAQGYGTLMIARVVTSFAHGSFFGIGAVVAASLVSVDKRASAIALMFTGLTLANVLGVPFGTFVGQMLGWRATFWIVAALGVASFAGIAALVPKQRGAAGAALGHELRVLKEPQVWLALAMTVLGFGGVFVVFTYIAPILEDVAGFSPHAVSLVLVLFGAGLTVGNVIGGKLADRALMPSLMAILVALIAVMAVFAKTSHLPVAAAVTVFVWGIAAFATVPPLQSRVVEKAAHAPNLASTLNIGAFNVGNAGGAWLGGVALSHGVPLDALPWVAAVVTLAALAVTVLAARLDTRVSSGAAATAQ
ncbi:MFS transporter [Burkholderia oklahomensis]|uniref:Sugar (And other) transporter family protein n=1 Tax=Burkholderia oklahomensis TaxID=342113 RepID=A0AAI8FPH8_9BURK|nr:MFS transporter [Burkholderia oklahomensis]AIO67955.1 sugar (and other) transporter family protein [Burkholderia oklahomensis]AJX30779.1 sugar (and other) transporter family protein [Burkholderia oklahomensis C6786]AOI43480.1 arabinose transporter permease [Burkholderia oklahomensis EO147]AOI47047.1 arabinose transporter permease [Burkholderia oklahomensis C6786]KUY49124.1 arabinose transporter permease [Burkholderia oklahomensis EO147]